MNFQDAEKIYRDLKQQHAAGKLSDADFETEVAKLRLQDAQGRWWQLGVQTGDWYMHDGQKWNKAKPPSPQPAAPSAPPPLKEAAAPAAEAGATPPPRRGGSVLPARLFSAAPAGRGNGKGLSTPLLIGIIAIVAVVAIIILVGGYVVLSGALGSSTARATTTPTRSLAVLPSPVIPTITLAVPTDTPLPPPTAVITASETVTPTRSAPKPAPTKKPTVPPTPAGPTATKAPNVPPGVYVTDLQTIPSKANIGDTLGFKVSFLNTTGSTQVYNWFVKVYQCPEQCQDFKHSYGETLHTSTNIATGASDLSSSQTINLGTGIRCDLIARVNYVDPVSQLPVTFQATTTNNGYFSFTVCH